MRRDLALEVRQGLRLKVRQVPMCGSRGLVPSSLDATVNRPRATPSNPPVEDSSPVGESLVPQRGHPERVRRSRLHLRACVPQRRVKASPYDPQARARISSPCAPQVRASPCAP